MHWDTPEYLAGSVVFQQPLYSRLFYFRQNDHWNQVSASERDRLLAYGLVNDLTPASFGQLQIGINQLYWNLHYTASHANDDRVQQVAALFDGYAFLPADAAQETVRQTPNEIERYVHAFLSDREIEEHNQAVYRFLSLVYPDRYPPVEIVAEVAAPASEELKQWAGHLNQSPLMQELLLCAAQRERITDHMVERAVAYGLVAEEDGRAGLHTLILEVWHQTREADSVAVWRALLDGYSYRDPAQSPNRIEKLAHAILGKEELFYFEGQAMVFQSQDSLDHQTLVFHLSGVNTDVGGAVIGGK